MLDELRVRRARPDSVPVTVLLNAGEATLQFPDPAATILGVTLGLLAIVTGLVFTRELVDQRIKAPYDMQLLPASRLMGVVPASSEDENSKGDYQGVVHRHPHGLVAESFRGIRTQLLEACREGGHKTVMVVGAHAGSGTSSTLANLALSLAMHGSRVLVIDADMRRPTQHRLLAVGDGPGLVDVVSGSATFQDAVRHRDDPSMDVLTTGNVGGSSPEMLERPAFLQLLEQARQAYDIVLIDTPPALLTAENAMLAQVVDASVVVVRAMHDKRGTVGRMLRQLGDQPAVVLGVIMNDLRASHGGYLKRNYRAYYEYQRGAAKPAT
jgi:capsular exopolysaccharide synthesis family protein